MAENEKARPDYTPHKEKEVSDNPILSVIRFIWNWLTTIWD